MGSIFVNKVGKKYKRYTKKVDRLFEWVSMNQKVLHEEQWVLRGITFSVEPGESVGIIGQNGAGKSTLLKMLTGTTKPTEGSIASQGRIAALLELGMGFNPDFTGRQNTYITGQLMGLSNEEITQLMPSIEAFAEIGDYMDQPLRTYSSGMAVRVAFAAATAIRPDILIVDEALSVGDAYFQQKCFNRIKKFKEEGTTLLFVSHDPGAVKNLCDRAILLDKGLLVKEGRPEEILDYYNAVIAKREADYTIQQSQGKGERMITRSGDGTAKIVDVKILSNGKPVNAVQVGEMIDVQVEIRSIKEMQKPTVGILFKDRLGNEIFGTNTFHQGVNLGVSKPEQKMKISFKVPVQMGIGHYSLTVAIHDGSTHVQGNYDWWDHAATIQVIPGKEGPFVGVCYLPTQCTEIMGDIK
jgi:lipopolysaccharide transport system ATP-binding protein